MPTAGDEGYEQLVICPYDRAHEIRRGRIQFHLDKCRKNHKDKQGEMFICPYNSCHNVPSAESEYHTEEDCGSHANWQRYTHEIGDVSCPVKDLVPVNAATVPDGDENWDQFESQGSVLETLKTQAAEKDVLRMLQCESKAKRKKFRREEQLRHSQMQGLPPPIEDKATDYIKKKVSKPTKFHAISQDPSAAMATIQAKFNNLDLKPSPSTCVPSKTSYNSDAPPSSAVSDCSYASTSSSRPGTAMSSALSSSTSRPNTSRPTTSRPSTAMSIAASVNRPFLANNVADDDGFCQIPIPGLGRGSAAHRKMKL